MFFDSSDEIIGDGLKAIHSLFNWQINRFENLVDEVTKEISILFRESEHLRDDRNRNVLCVVNRGINGVFSLEWIKQFCAEFSDKRFKQVYLFGCKDRLHEPPGVRMEWRVRGDRRSNANWSRQCIFARSAWSNHHCSRREVLSVMGDGGDVGVASWQPRATVTIAVSDGTVFSQVIPDRVGVFDPHWISVIKVGGEIFDWRVFRHMALYSVIEIAYSGQFCCANRAASC